MSSIILWKFLTPHRTVYTFNFDTFDNEDQLGQNEATGFVLIHAGYVGVGYEDVAHVILHGNVEGFGAVEDITRHPYLQ